MTVSTALIFSERLLSAIHDRVAEEGGDKWDKRRAVAHYVGYEDAKFIVAHMFATLGFPLEESACWVGSRGYRLDLEGLRHELVMLGMDGRSIEIHLERMLEAERMGAMERAGAGQ